MTELTTVESLLAEGLAERALVMAQQAVSESPDDAEAQSVLARALFYSGQGTAAILAAERSTKLAPKDPTLWARLGGLYAANTRLEEARTACEKALSLDPHNTMGLLNLAQTLASLELRAEAQATLERLADVATESSLDPSIRDAALSVTARVSHGDARDLLERRFRETSAHHGSVVSVLRRNGPRMATGAQESTLQRLGRDLTQLARAQKLDPVTGRDHEIESMMLILSRKKKANPVLVGEPGVGKTACVEGLAQRIARGDVPAALRSARVIELSMASIFAGSSLRGELEARVQTLLAELREDRSSIVFIDEIHTLVSPQSQGDLGVAEMLKPALARGELSLIGATTSDGYERSIMRDPALARRFERVAITEPVGELLSTILHSVAKEMSLHHRVQISAAMIETVIAECARWLPERAMPDVGSDVLDRAAAMASRTRVLEVTVGHLREAIASMGLASTDQLYASVPQTRSTLRAKMLSNLYGQEPALTAMIDQYALGVLRAHTQPRCTLWLKGPASVGKHSAIALLSAATDRPIIRWNLGVLSERHDTTRLLGAPAGYTGYDDGSTLTRALRATPNAILCLDAPENAHPEVQALIAQSLSDGAFVDARGWRAELRRACVVFVSDVADSPTRAIGYSSSKSTYAEGQVIVEPSLLSTMDSVVQFAPLERDSLLQLLQSHMERTLAQLARDGLVCATDTQRTCAWLLDDKSRGAKAAIKRFETEFLQPLLQAVVADSHGHALCAVVADNKLTFASQ